MKTQNFPTTREDFEALVGKAVFFHSPQTGEEVVKFIHPGIERVWESDYAYDEATESNIAPTKKFDERCLVAACCDGQPVLVRKVWKDDAGMEWVQLAYPALGGRGPRNWRGMSSAEKNAWVEARFIVSGGDWFPKTEETDIEPKLLLPLQHCFLRLEEEALVSQVEKFAEEQFEIFHKAEA